MKHCNKIAVEFSNHHVPLMKQFSSVLYGVGIRNVHYIRVYSDGRYLHLNPSEELNSFYAEKITQPSRIIKNFLNTPSSEQLWPERNLDFLFQWLVERNFAHGYVIRHKSEDYYESWSFNTYRDNYLMPQVYPQIRPDLYRFIKYFKRKIKPIIELSDPYLAKYQKFDWTPLENQKNLNISLKLPDLPWFYQGKEVFLTDKQTECLELLIRGFGMKAIAQSLNISPRTVEFHVQAIKEKFGINYKSQLIHIYNQNVNNSLCMDE